MSKSYGRVVCRRLRYEKMFNINSSDEGNEMKIIMVNALHLSDWRDRIILKERMWGKGYSSISREHLILLRKYITCLESVSSK